MMSKLCGKYFTRREKNVFFGIFKICQLYQAGHTGKAKNMGRVKNGKICSHLFRFSPRLLWHSPSSTKSIMDCQCNMTISNLISSKTVTKALKGKVPQQIFALLLLVLELDCVRASSPDSCVR